MTEPGPTLWVCTRRLIEEQEVMGVLSARHGARDFVRSCYPAPWIVMAIESVPSDEGADFALKAQAQVEFEPEQYWRKNTTDWYDFTPCELDVPYLMVPPQPRSG